MQVKQENEAERDKRVRLVEGEDETSLLVLPKNTTTKNQLTVVYMIFINRNAASTQIYKYIHI